MSQNRKIGPENPICVCLSNLVCTRLLLRSLSTRNILEVINTLGLQSHKCWSCTNQIVRVLTLSSSNTRPPKSYVLELHESNCKSTNIIFFEIGNGQILLLLYHIVKVDRVRDRDTDSSTHTAFLDPTCSTSLGWTCCRTQDCL